MMIIRLAFLLFAGLLVNESQAAELKMAQYPNTSKTEITFTYAGDIYTAPISGGNARKLTSHSGLELMPRFSPNGDSIAFSGEYDGNREVYVMPSNGGQPQRLTFSADMPHMAERQGPDKIIMQWTKDSKILFRSRAESWNVLVGKLYQVSASGSPLETVPVPRSGFASLSPDGSQMAYNRIFREYRTWKRYRGGQADDIWIFDFKTKELTNISNNPAQDIIPMWAGNKIYYLSDRDHTMNLFCYNLDTKTTKKITNFTKYDIKFPSLGAEHISFENGGELYTLKLMNDELQIVPITISDDYVWSRPEIVNVKKSIAAFDIMPDAKSAVFSARGDVFLVPKERGLIKNLTHSPSAHDRNPAVSPDGMSIAFISDETGEDEIYTIKPDGTNKKQITKNAESYRFEIKWSPDSKKILCSDKTMKLYYIDVETGITTNITKSKVWEIRDFNWSPDSKWVAYTDAVNSEFNTIHLFSLESGKITQITSDFYTNEQPVFSNDGKYLFFSSARTFNPTISNVEWNFAYSNMNKIYGIALRADAVSPVAEISPKFITEEAALPETAKTKKQAKIEEEMFRIDLNGIMDRIFEIDIPASNYAAIYANENNVYYMRFDQGKAALYSYDLQERKEDKLGDVSNYVLTPDAKNILFSTGGEYYISKLKENLSTKDGKINLDNMEMNIVRKEEWKQIFNEAWRQMKYFFYDPNMHGVDWQGMKEKYGALVPFAEHRSDITRLIGEMIGELNIGHAYVGGGDMPDVKSVSVGMLGADFAWDKAANAYKIKKIYEGRNWDEEKRSPLTELGVNIAPGEYLYSIDGIVLTETVPPGSALVNKASKYVELGVSKTSGGKNIRKVTVKTIPNEAGVRYLDWVETNRRYVDSVTGGKVGYIHIPDMGVDNGLIEFTKYFYPQTRKEALIVDDRYNGGGNVSPMVIERLRRVLVVAKNARNQEFVGTNPDAVMTGAMVLLINEQSMSDGDLFPYQFNKLGLGKIIGKRSWGGVIGIRGSLPFIDGGYLNRPEFANFGADGTWILEGVGMTPDIDQDNNPDKEYNGIDEQLNKAIQVVLEDMKTNTKTTVPKVPVYPIKK